MANGLPVSSVVNVSVLLAPTAAGSRNFGSLLVLGDSDVIDTSERMRLYESLDDIATNFGTTAEEYKAALAYYSAEPKPRVCYVGRWAKTATHGRLKGAILGTAEQAIALFQAITAGAFAVTIDGVVVNVTAVNLSAETNLNGVASAITTKLGAAGTCLWDGSRFVINSATTGTGSTVGGMTSTPLSQVMNLDTGTTAVAGIAAETLVDAVALLADMSTDWYGLVVSASATDQELIDAAAFIGAAGDSRVMAITTQDTSALDAEDTSDIASALKGTGNNRAFVQYSSSNKHAAAAALGRAFTVNFNGQNTVITLKFKQEPAVTPEVLTSSQAATLKSKRCNVFAQYSNDTAILQEGVMSGGWFFDERHGLDWLQNDVQTAIWNRLYTSTTKVAQTDAGVGRLTTTMEDRLDQAVTNGLLAPGQWNGDDLGALKTGDTLTKGYYVYAPPVADQSQADREARKAPVLQAATKLAGAVHFVDVIITANR